METSWIAQIREKSLRQLKVYFGFKETDYVIFGGLFYSKRCYVLSLEEYQLCNRLVVNFSLVLAFFTGIQWVFFVDILGGFWAELLLVGGVLSVFTYYGLRLFNILSKGASKVVDETPAWVYSNFIAENSPQDKLSTLVNKTFIVFLVLSISLIAVVFKERYAAAVLGYLLMAVLWSMWWILFKAKIKAMELGQENQ